MAILAYVLFSSPSEPEVEVENEDVAVENEDVFARSDIAGTWVSTTDSQFVRTINADGTVVDTYEGDEAATMTGTWSWVDDVSVEPVELPSVENQGTIKMEFGDEDALYFAVTPDSTASELSLIFLTGNGVLTFTRAE